MKTSAPITRAMLVAMLLLPTLAGCMQDTREASLATQALAQRKGELADSFAACERDSTTPQPAVVAEARCLVFNVAENPAQPEGRQIPLRVMLVPAIRSLPEPDPFVILVGGPGQAATDVALEILPAFELIRRNRDILLVDQRGTGRLSPFACDFAAESGDLASAELLLAIQLQGLQDCLAGSAAAPEYYTTDLAATDLEALRRHLGYHALNLWGVSYGTRVALAYLKYFPAATRTVVLDGVAPPGILPLEAARDGWRALQNVFRLCADESACAAAFPQLQEHYQELLARHATPQMSVLRDPADGSQREWLLGTAQIEGSLLQMLYSREATRLIPLFIEELYEGNPQVLSWAEGSQVDLNVAQHYSVLCNEDLPLVSTQALAAAATDPQLLGYELLVKPRVEGCRNWPRRVLPDDFFAPLVSDTPVLIFSGAQDPVTPPHWGDTVAATLGNVRHVVAAGVGHGVFAYGCSVRLISSLVDTASLQGLDASCMESLAVRPFFTSWGGSGGDDQR